ncbi:MAG: NAD(P)H-hydrate dehydratase [Candidatus Geothermarchaeales archaeon]
MTLNMSSHVPEVITSQEMEAIDRNCAYLGIPRLILMENAGRSVSDVLLREFDPVGLAVIVAGTGNNGGDGFVAARHLVNRGVKVDVFLVGRAEEIRTDEARANWEIIRNMRHNISIHPLRSPDDLDFLAKSLETSDVVVDAMLGTGVRGEIREPFKSVIKTINDSNKPVLAVDTPTGIDPTTGDIHGVAVSARCTVTFHKAKRGLTEAEEHVGKLIVEDIGIPSEAEVFAGPGDVLLAAKVREKTSHKGDQGRLLVIGGSDRFSGAPALTSLAALRTGIDIVIVAAPMSVSQAIRSFSPNLIVHPLDGEILMEEHLPTLGELLGRVDAVAIGPGLGDRGETLDACTSFIRDLNIPAVIDADALKAVGRDVSIPSLKRCVLTPHVGEFKVLTGLEIRGSTEEAALTVIDHAKSFETTILLKRYEDIVTDGERLKINRTGNPGMTVGGTGDVLTGIVGAYLAKGVAPFRSAVAAAFLNGLAGDIAVEDKGYHIVASDLIDRIPMAYARCGLRE